jgi:uncharacterized membrane protein YqjE
VSDGDAPPPGSWAGLLETLLGLTLGGLEREKRRCFEALLLGAAALLAIGIGTLLSLGLLLALLQEAWRPAAAAFLAVAFGAAGAGLIALARARLLGRDRSR